MVAVSVEKDLAYTASAEPDLLMDVYAPPDREPVERKRVSIVVRLLYQVRGSPSGGRASLTLSCQRRERCGRAPRFREAIETARRSPSVPLEESSRRAGFTEEELAAADAEIDRLLAQPEDD
jgi:hypothetical protein